MDNSRFKFRAWNNEDKEMTSKYGFYLNTEGEILSQRHYVVMQCTGAKDRNGQDIYEGDILLEQMMPFDDAICVVVWNPDDAGFCLDYGEEEGMFSQSMNAFQVIGNIYETPEIIKNER